MPLYDRGAALDGTLPSPPDRAERDASPARTSRPGVKHISLALQGGGSHGAFTWGGMHRLMSEPRVYIGGNSGTSLGAMNGGVVVDGFLKGKRQGATDALPPFWARVAKICPL